MNSFIDTISSIQIRILKSRFGITLSWLICRWHYINLDWFFLRCEWSNLYRETCSRNWTGLKIILVEKTGYNDSTSESKIKIKILKYWTAAFFIKWYMPVNSNSESKLSHKLISKLFQAGMVTVINRSNISSSAEWRYPRR